MHPIKTNILTTCCWILVFLAPIRETMVATMFLLLMDLAVGIWASLKRGDKFSSAKLSRTCTKLVSYQLALITSFVVETYMLEVLPLVKATAGLIATTEILSVFESISSISGVPVRDAIKSLLDRSANKGKDTTE